MTVQQEVSQISAITERAMTQLKWVQRVTGLRLLTIEIALYELQDAVNFLKERLNKC